MGRCSNAVLMHKIGVPKLDDKVEVTFSLFNDITNCNAINTRDYLTGSTGVQRYAMYDRPANKFDCEGGVCTNTGTLHVTGTSSAVSFTKELDASEFANGLITFYAYKEADATLPTTYTVTISDTASFTNADVYELVQKSDGSGDIPAPGADGFAIACINLQDTPSDTEGTGWSGTGNAIFVKVSTGVAFGISTITFYKSVAELAVGNIVKLSCLTEVGGSFDVSALEDSCVTSGYDRNSNNGGIDWTVTGKLMTSNFWRLNPLNDPNAEKGSMTGFRVTTVKKTIGSDGKVAIADINADICDFIGAQIDDKCVTPAADIMHRVMTPVAVAMAYDQFYVQYGESGATFVFNTDLAGKDVLITYPQTVTLKERIVGNNDNLGEVRAKMSYPVKNTDGSEEIHVYHNVLITSFPASFNNEDDQEVSFTINIHPDADGNWYEVQRVLA